MRLPAANTLPCVRCGRRGSNRHEKVPRGRGGPRDEFNTIILCGSGTTGCHGWVTSHPIAAIAHGFSVSGAFLRGRYVGPSESYRWHYNAERWVDGDWVADDEGEAVGGAA